MTTTELLTGAPKPSQAARRRNVLLSVVGAMVVIAVLLTLIRSAFDDPPPTGPSGSSYASTSGGVGAFAELASRAGVTVERLTEDPSDDPELALRLGTGATIVVLGTDLATADLHAVIPAVYSGARLVADIGPGNLWLTEAFPELRWRGVTAGPSTVEARATLPAGGPGQLLVIGTGLFDDVVPSDDNTAGYPILEHAPIAERSGVSIAERFPAGAGEVIALADASMLSNELLDDADNAAFGLALLDGRSRVVFAEASHGYRRRPLTPTGLPWQARWFLGALLFATLCLMWTRSHRNGPAEPTERELAPARSEYLHAMVTSIEASGRRRFVRRGPRVPLPLTQKTPPPTHPEKEVS